MFKNPGEEAEKLPKKCSRGLVEDDKNSKTDSKGPDNGEKDRGEEKSCLNLQKATGRRIDTTGELGSK